MPTYEYRCNDCGHGFEQVQKFSDDPLETCPECGGTLRKVFGSVGIVLKGSGFYKTDSRSSSSASTPASSGSTGSSDAGSSAGSTSSAGSSSSD